VRITALRPPAIVYAVVPIGAVAFWFFREYGLVASTPYWVVLLLLVLTAALNLITFAALDMHPGSRFYLHARLCVSALTTAAFLGVVGWGPLLVIGYAVGMAAMVEQAGAESWRLGFAWCAVGILLGEIAVTVGWAPTLIDPGLANAVAISGVICLFIVARVLGDKAARAEAAEVELRERGEHFESLIEHAVDVIAVLDLSGTIVFASPAVQSMLGVAPGDLEGCSIATLLEARDLAVVRSLLRRVIREPGALVTSEVAFRHVDGSLRLAVVTMTHSDRTDGVVMNAHDVTVQRALEERLRSDALHDALTGLWNRSAFMEHADTALARASRDGSTIAVLFVDLNGFKQINDAFGHDFGDEVLADVALRLRRCLRNTELVARFGGDEFTVLVQGVERETQVVAIAERICSTLHRDEDEEGLTLGASIGIVLDTGGTVPVAELLRRADEAMYSAKRSGHPWEIANVVTDVPDSPEGVERDGASPR
jgi:diguanylate cyclase (GGDEF)-like protein/PAS domain S-box-containing protein